MWRPPVLATAGLTLLTVVAACSQEQDMPAVGAGAEAAGEVGMNTQGTTIAATLFYRERIALPPGAVAVAALELADSGTVITERRENLADRSVPVAVTLDVDQSQLPKNDDLLFRGSIEVDGTPRWQSEPRPVDLTSGTVDLGSVMLLAVDEPDAAAHDSPGMSSLTGIWVVEDIRGGGIIDDSRVTLEFSDQRVAGRASCNAYQGAWSLKDGILSISDVAVTLMACPDALMNQERRFLDALASADGVRFDDTGALYLTSDDDDLLRARREG